MSNATPTPQPPRMQPIATWNPTRGVWESSQLDFYGQPAPFSENWPTSGMTRNGSAYPLPTSARRILGFGFSSSPTALFRTPVASDAKRGSETAEQVRARGGTVSLSHQIIALALHGPAGSQNNSTESETLWLLVEDIFTAGDATPTPSPDGNTSPDDQPQHQRS